MAGPWDKYAEQATGEGPWARYVATDADPVAVKAGSAINSIPRSLGLTARYGLEGLANAAQVVTEPIRYATDRLTGMTGKTVPLGNLATRLADAVGLPSPQSADERVVADATRLVAGAGGLGGAAQLGAKLPGMAGTVLSGLAANPGAQLSSAAGAGLAGGSSREAGGSAGLQTAAALLGGVAGGMTPAAAAAVGGLIRRPLTPSMSPQQLDVQISGLLERAGADYSKVPEQIRRSLRAEVQSSLQAGKELDPQAVKRLADFASVGATPTRGMISQNPVQITREMNLAKMAANSSDGELQGLPLLQNRNNQALIDQMNALGGRTETDALAAGRKLVDSIGGTRDSLRSAEQTLWREAKGMPGYKTGELSTEPVHQAFAAASETGMLDYLAKPVAARMKAYMTGKVPFTPQEYANLRSLVSGSLSPTSNANEKKVAKAVTDALDSAQIRMRTTNPGGIDYGNLPSTSSTAAAMRSADAAPGASIDAINRARAATRQAYAYEDSSPLVKAALSDSRTADPENLARSFVLNGTLRDAQSVAQEVGPQGVSVIRDAVATHIKRQALGGSADETGKVSQSALNAALNKIGKEKLAVFFSPEEVQQFRTLGRVASLIQNQPVGSAVNNSNSGALLLGRGMDLLNKTPFLGPMTGPALRNIGVSVGQRQAQNLTPGLLAPVERQPMAPALLLPGLTVGGGLLSAPQ